MAIRYNRGLTTAAAPHTCVTVAADVAAAVAAVTIYISPLFFCAAAAAVISLVLRVPRDITSRGKM